MSSAIKWGGSSVPRGRVVRSHSEAREQPSKGPCLTSTCQYWRSHSYLSAPRVENLENGLTVWQDAVEAMRKKQGENGEGRERPWGQVVRWPGEGLFLEGDLNLEAETAACSVHVTCGHMFVGDPGVAWGRRSPWLEAFNPISKKLCDRRQVI